MRARDWTETQNQRDQSGAGRDRIREQRDGDISTRQPVAHDAGADDGRQQEGRPERFSYSTPGHSTP